MVYELNAYELLNANINQIDITVLYVPINKPFDLLARQSMLRFHR